jgi:hypothetical protein
MASSSVNLTAAFARRIPDPVFHQDHKTERHILFVPVRSVPAGLPLDPNARIPNLRRRIYQEIENSLLDRDTTPGTFHLKHKGITVVAESVTRHGENNYTVALGKNHGIVDGAHTYQLIVKNLATAKLPEKQFVKFEILTAVPPEWIVDIAGGLNTSVQVQQFALDNLAGKFKWIQKALHKEPYYATIAWKENQDGDFDARDIISLLTCFNVELFPNASKDGDTSDTNPVVAYEKKSKALEMFEQNMDSYKKLRPILKEILVLHDTIRLEAQQFHNAGGGTYGNLSYVEGKQRGFQYPFISQQSEYRLMNAALYPILGAFRWMVEIEPKSNKARWRGGFKAVLQVWRSNATELLKMTQQKNEEEGRNPNAVGKSRTHWSSLYSRLALREMQSRA